jgi:hypothetical protein
MMDGPAEGPEPKINGVGSGIADAASWEAEFHEQVAVVENAARAWASALTVSRDDLSQHC